MINVIGAIISGMIVGGLARWFYPGAVDMGCITTILLDVGGGKQNRPTLAGGPGSTNEHVAEVSAWHSNLSKETRRMLSKWSELQG